MDYLYHYERLIERAVRRGSRREKGLNQNHHINPECHGGLKTPENMVYLYHREHLIAHLLLVKMHPNDSKLIHAAFKMSNGKRYGSRKYAWLRKRFSIFISDMKKGITLSREHRNKISEGLKASEVIKKLGEIRKGISLPENHRNKISEGLKHILKSEEHRKNMCKKRGGYKNNGKVLGKIICPHCGLEGGKPAMLRWHFEKCKMKVPC